MDAGLKQFLDERKIDLEQMAKDASQGPSAKQLREFAATKSGHDEIPDKVEDYFLMKMKKNTMLIKNLQDNCFEKCAQSWDAGMLTYNEGLCVRNCFTKFGNWYPTLNYNMRDAPVMDYYQLLQEARGNRQ